VYSNDCYILLNFIISVGAKCVIKFWQHIVCGTWDVLF